MLGQNKVSYQVPRFHGDEGCFFVEGLSFPGAGMKDPDHPAGASLETKEQALAQVHGGPRTI